MAHAEQIASEYNNQIPMSDSQARAIAYGIYSNQEPDVQCQLYFLLMDID